MRGELSRAAHETVKELMAAAAFEDDSASLTAGAVAAAPTGHRGATLAVHSTLGSSAAFLGPLAIGATLDLFGGTTFAWGMAFITMGLGCVMGPVALALLGRSRRS